MCDENIKNMIIALRGEIEDVLCNKLTYVHTVLTLCKRALYIAPTDTLTIEQVSRAENMLYAAISHTRNKIDILIKDIENMGESPL